MLMKKTLQRFRVGETAYSVVKHEVRFLSAHFCVSVFRAKLRKSIEKEQRKQEKRAKVFETDRLLFSQGSLVHSREEQIEKYDPASSEF